MLPAPSSAEPLPIPRATPDLKTFSAARLVVAGLLLLLLSLIIKSAWLGDDFYIGARSLDNFLNGHGLRWNVIERVQVFTAPFWFLLLTAFYVVTGEVFLTTILLSIVTSMAAVIVLARYAASSSIAAAAALVTLISSRAFVDYTTSGLENPLSYLLVALFCIAFCREPVDRRMLQQLILLSALVGFNRMDLMLILFPAVAYVLWIVLWKRKVPFWSVTRDAVLFSLPLWGWLLFSIIYYGYPFPNTYYAKLYTGIPKGEQLVQGFLYYLSSLNADPVTLFALALATVGLVASRNPRFIAAGIGVILYLVYVVKIGGDFMNGRFFSVPLFFSLAFLVQLQLSSRSWAALGLLSVGIGLLAPKPTLFYNESFWVPLENLGDRRGIADERAVYYPEVGLLTVLQHNKLAPTHGWSRWGRDARQLGRQLVVFGTPGMYGYYAGPDVHIVDYYCLSDPLLSKLPIVSGKPWRVGHYPRAIPDGYLRSIQTGDNLIEDRAVRELYRVTKLLAQGPLFTRERWTEIAKMNLGYYKPLIRAASKSKRSTEPPLNEVVSYPWPDPITGAGSAVGAVVSAKWDRESEGVNSFWWTDKDARFEFILPEHADARRPLAVSVERYGREVRLQFIVNSQPVEAEMLDPIAGFRFVRMVIRGPWKPGTNTVEIIGSGEPMQPAGGDPRHLLFAIREPVWQ